MKTYVTNAGDMWDSIAQKMYGSTDHTGKLMAYNSDYLESNYIFHAGVVLRVPDLTNKDADLSYLPPWRR